MATFRSRGDLNIEKSVVPRIYDTFCTTPEGDSGDYGLKIWRERGRKRYREEDTAKSLSFIFHLITSGQWRPARSIVVEKAACWCSLCEKKIKKKGQRGKEERKRTQKARVDTPRKFSNPFPKGRLRLPGLIKISLSLSLIHTHTYTHTHSSRDEHLNAYKLDVSSGFVCSVLLWRDWFFGFHGKVCSEDIEDAKDYVSRDYVSLSIFLRFSFFCFSFSSRHGCCFMTLMLVCGQAVRNVTRNR